MQCKKCGKENLEDAQYCSGCGESLVENSKVCKHCDTKNKLEARFCKKCGRAFDEKNICPTCGLENVVEAKYCKHCGTSLIEKEKKKVSRFIFQIISLCFCSFIILYCFGVTFADFLYINGEGLNLSFGIEYENINVFQVIKNIATIEDNQMASTLGVYGKVSSLVPDIISLMGICTAMIGCFVVCCIAISQVVRSGLKRSLPNLEKLSILSIGFLTIGLLICSLNHVFLNMSSSEETLKIGYRYSPIVLSAVCIGIIWLLVIPIVEFVFRLIEGASTEEIRNKIFKFVEFLLLVVLLFNIAINFAKLYVNQEENQLSLYFSGLSYFEGVYMVAGLTSLYGIKMSAELVQSLVMSTILLIVMIAFVVFTMLFLINRTTKKKEQASLCCGIVLFSTAVLYIILSCVTAPMIIKDIVQLQMKFESSISSEVYDVLKATISGSVIVTVVFSGLLFILEIVWKALESKNNFSKRVDLN